MHHKHSPSEITIKRGEAIRFEVKNSGKTMHEIVFGTMKEFKEHAEMMREHPGMKHDEPYMAHVAPGKSERIVWQSRKRASSITVASFQDTSKPA